MIDAKMVREIASKYIYDRCPAIVGVGKKIACFIVSHEHPRCNVRRASASEIIFVYTRDV